MNTAEVISSILEHYGVNKNQFAKNIGVTATQIYDLISGKTKKISDMMRDKIVGYYNEINPVFLQTGEGDMLKHVPSTKEEAAPKGKAIRYWVDVDATGGGVQLFDDTLTSHHIDIQIPQFSDCTDAVNLSGDSMHPLYRGGDIIILKEWTESFIEYGNVYLIITRNGNRMVKRIQPGGDAAHITCVSENPEYKPFEVERGDILRLYIVKGSISKNVL